MNFSVVVIKNMSKVIFGIVLLICYFAVLDAHVESIGKYFQLGNVLVDVALQLYRIENISMHKVSVNRGKKTYSKLRQPFPNTIIEEDYKELT